MTARSGPGMRIKEPPGLRVAPTSETALHRIVGEGRRYHKLRSMVAELNGGKLLFIKYSDGVHDVFFHDNVTIRSSTNLS